jgi:hypothetical protein
MKGGSGYRIFPEILPVVQFKGVDVLRTYIRITDLGRIKVAIRNIRLHIEKLRTCGTTGIGSQQAMLIRERIAQMHRWEKLKTILRTIRSLHGTSQDRMRMLSPNAGLRL